jgi:hypothetical protein
MCGLPKPKTAIYFWLSRYSWPISSLFLQWFWCQFRHPIYLEFCASCVSCKAIANCSIGDATCAVMHDAAALVSETSLVAAPSVSLCRYGPCASCHVDAAPPPSIPLRTMGRAVAICNGIAQLNCAYMQTMLLLLNPEAVTPRVHLFRDIYVLHVRWPRL